MKLSIIIPCYNAEPFIHELLKRLDGQITDEVEVILVDDGSKNPLKTDYEWCKVIRQKNGGASVARNTGLDNATGEYIAFIDADDLVSANYISLILDKIESENPDYIYLSWKTLPGGWDMKVLLKSINDKFPPYNLCVWNRVYRKSLIGDVRFNPKKLIAEDAEFIRSVETEGKKKAFIGEFAYYYRSNTPDSLSKRFRAGKLDTKRVVYYFKQVRKGMEYLIDEFAKDDKEGEVILLTEVNEIPELEKYAMVMRPCHITATEKKGESTDMIDVIKEPIKTQVVMWTKKTYNMGGIETFIYSFCMQMKDHYDIMVLYDEMDSKQIERLEPYVECRKNSPNIPIECDTIIVNRILSSDAIPDNVTYKKSIQMVHGIKNGGLHVPQDKDTIVSVSEAVKESFGKETEDSVVIRNMTYHEPNNALILVSTTRTDTADKGGKRMVQLANLMNAQGVPFTWLCFTNAPLPRNAPENMIRIAPTMNVLPFVEKADYLVQLSDHEAFCYSLVESLEAQTPVICTPLGVLEELGVREGENAYIVPFDFGSTFDTRKFLNVPKFKYEFDNKESVKRWKKVLGNTKPKHTYKYTPEEIVKIKLLRKVTDTETCETIEKGTVIERKRKRADKFIKAGYAVEV